VLRDVRDYGRKWILAGGIASEKVVPHDYEVLLPTGERDIQTPLLTKKAQSFLLI
jgi:hypothetical protein